MTHDVIDNPAADRFEMPVDGEIAFIRYRRHGTVVTLTHAEVPPASEGHGHGSRLVAGTLDLVRAAGETVVPRCSFVRAYLRRHPEHNDLVADNL
jgi:predicted GNAT family acetyltransferase